MPFLAQDALDYSNDAQIRVSATLRNLRKRTTFQVSAGTPVYELPDDVIQLLVVMNGKTRLDPVTCDQALALLSGADLSSLGNAMVTYSFTPGTVGFYPTPTADFTASIYYVARAQPLSSDDEFELVGAPETLIEHLVAAYQLDDDAQPEVAEYEYAFFALEASSLRRNRLNQAQRRLSVMGQSR